MLLVEAEELHVLFQQGELDVGLVLQGLQFGNFLFDVGLFYGIAYPASLVDGLRKVDFVVLQPVGRLWPGGV